MLRVFTYIFIVVYFLHVCQPTHKGVEMVPERVKIEYTNPKYIGENVYANVRRSSRGGIYVVNLSGKNNQVWGNNVSLSLVFYEFLHNEYRRTFIEVTYKLCDFINNDVYGKRIQLYGIVCPLYVKTWTINNATIELPAFTYTFPFKRCKVEVALWRTVPTTELISRGFLFLKVKQIL